MKPHYKSVVAAGLILLILSMGMNIVFAVNSNAEPGSDQDPIVSKSYVDAAIAQLTTKIQLLTDQNNTLTARLSAQEQAILALQTDFNKVMTGASTPSKSGTGTGNTGNTGSTGTKPPATTPTTLGKAVVNTAVLNLRSQPNTTSSIITKLVKGETVTLVSKSGDWYKITTSKGKTGYVMAKFVTKK